jgi:hypothetical protein
MTFEAAQVNEMVDLARNALRDESWVEWATTQAGDLNEEALVAAYQTIDELAKALEWAAP